MTADGKSETLWCETQIIYPPMLFYPPPLSEAQNHYVTSADLICPVNERVCVCVFILFSITCLVTYRLNAAYSSTLQKTPICKGTISAVYQSKCASATM